VGIEENKINCGLLGGAPFLKKRVACTAKYKRVPEKRRFGMVSCRGKKKKQG
jgi:hypothetical protein